MSNSLPLGPPTTTVQQQGSTYIWSGTATYDPQMPIHEAVKALKAEIENMKRYSKVLSSGDTLILFTDDLPEASVVERIVQVFKRFGVSVILVKAEDYLIVEGGNVDKMEHDAVKGIQKLLEDLGASLDSAELLD